MRILTVSLLALVVMALTVGSAAASKSKAAARKLVDAQIASFAGGDSAVAYAPDARFQFLLSGNSKLRADRLVKKMRDMTGGVEPRLSDYRVGVASDGKSAWVGFRLAVGKTSIRVTELLADKSGTWTIYAGQFSLPVRDALVMKKLADQSMPGYGATTAKDEPSEDELNGAGADDLALAYDEQVGQAKPSRFAQFISKRADVFAFGSAPGETFTGKQLGRLFGKYAHDIDDYVRVGTTPSGTVGYVAGKLKLQVGKQWHVYRIFFVYENDKGDWGLVQAHFSNPID